MVAYGTADYRKLHIDSEFSFVAPADGLRAAMARNEWRDLDAPFASSIWILQLGSVLSAGHEVILSELLTDAAAM